MVIQFSLGDTITVDFLLLPLLPTLLIRIGISVILCFLFVSLLSLDSITTVADATTAAAAARVLMIYWPGWFSLDLPLLVPFPFSAAAVVFRLERRKYRDCRLSVCFQKTMISISRNLSCLFSLSHFLPFSFLPFTSNANYLSPLTVSVFICLLLPTTTTTAFNSPLVLHSSFFGEMCAVSRRQSLLSLSLSLSVNRICLNFSVAAAI